MKEWQIIISKAENGFILSWEEECDCEGKYRTERKVFEVKYCYTENDERETLANALWHIIDFFGLGYLKYYKDEDRFIKISMVPGDNYFDKEEEEEGFNEDKT